MREILKKPSIYFVILIFIIYILLNVFLSGFYKTIKLIVIYAGTVNWIELGASIFLTVVIGILVSINTVLFYIKYKERRKCKEAGAVATAGTLGGLAVGVCPLCITGIFPLIFSLFGLSFTFASLPFKGIEIQVLVVLTLLVSLWMMEKK